MSVTAAKGFRACGVAAGIKSSGQLDLMLLVNDGPMKSTAAVFTTNKFAAAPVVWTRQVVRDGRVDALVINSGGANACTGPDGFADTHRTAELVAAGLGISAGDVAVCSTGLIGARLPMDRVESGLNTAITALSLHGGEDAARAIMTTDSVPKIAMRESGGATFGGIAKGAGMLAPELATMLVALTTDAVVDSDVLDRALRRAVRVSFDRVDSDGCQSTNDTVIAMASGASGVELSEDELTNGLTEICLSLAKQLIADAEGASKEITIEVRGAKSEADALLVARACARSNLLKCAIHGEDPNWGRVLSAIGTTEAEFSPENVNVSLNGVMISRGGAIGDDRSLVSMAGREVQIVIELGAGTCSTTLWTNDLTAAYVHENSAYSS